MFVVRKSGKIAVNAARSSLPRGRFAVAAAALLVFASAAVEANAGGIVSSGCVGRYGAFNCVTTWRDDGEARQGPRAPVDPKLAEEAAERERKWVSRCKPVIKQDAYGVRRYHYSAPGCEFGKAED